MARKGVPCRWSLIAQGQAVCSLRKEWFAGPHGAHPWVVEWPQWGSPRAGSKAWGLLVFLFEGVGLSIAAKMAGGSPTSKEDSKKPK